jgi:CheY-like chemotaxis protein
MVTRDGVSSRLTAARTAQAPAQLRVLLVGNREEDFFLIREILERTRNMFAADLDHTSSLEEAKAMLKEKTCGLVLFEHETGVTVPFIGLTEEADEKTVAEILERRTWNCVAKSHLDGATLVRTIRNTHTVLAAKDGVDALAVAKNQGTPIELLVTDVVMPNLANWRRNSLDCVRTQNCCSFLVMPARLCSTIK